MLDQKTNGLSSKKPILQMSNIKTVEIRSDKSKYWFLFLDIKIDRRNVSINFNIIDIENIITNELHHILDCDVKL